MLKNKVSNTRNSNSNRGFTLIEVMIAMVIFAIGILAMFSMQLKANNNNATARVYTQEANWAIDRMEKLMALPYTHAHLSDIRPFPVVDHSLAEGTLTQASDQIDNDNDGEIDEAGESGPIEISWSVQEDVPELNTKTIRVTVTQRNALQNGKEVTFEFIRADI